MRQAALALPDPAHEMLGLDPHLKETLRLQHELRDSLEEIRHRACHEVTLIWSTHGRILQPGSNALKPHIQQLYGTPQTCIQVVAMRKLADIFQWGDPTLLKELSEGFQLLEISAQVGAGPNEPMRDTASQSPRNSS